MADNTTLNTMSGGDVIATDDIGGVKYQIVKGAWGPLDTANLVDTASGKPFPVQNRGSDGTDRSLNAYTATTTFTCGTTAYAANDCVGAASANAALDLGVAGPNAGIVEIVSASLEIDAAAIISGETSYRLYIYNATPPSAINDSSPWTGIPSGDRASFLGYIDLGTVVALGTSPATLYVRQDNIGTRVKLSGTHLFGYLVTNGAYTPTARVFLITLHTQAP